MNNQLFLNTILLGGSTSEKVAAARAAGFDQIELWRQDVESVPEGSGAVRELLTGDNVGLTDYQVLLDFDGATGERPSAPRRRPCWRLRPPTATATLGRTLRLALAVLLVSVIGSGPAQFVITVVLGMLVGVLVGGGPPLPNQAAIIAISVALQFGSTPPFFGTLSSMLVGCGVALVVNYLLPIDPKARVKWAARLVLGELAAALKETAEA